MKFEALRDEILKFYKIYRPLAEILKFSERERIANAREIARNSARRFIQRSRTRKDYPSDGYSPKKYFRSACASPLIPKNKAI